MRLWQNEFFGWSKAAALVWAGALAGAANATPADELQQLFTDYWAFEMEHDPFSATGSGVHSHNDRVPDVSPASLEEILQARKRIKEQLDGIDLSEVSVNDRLSAQILEFILVHAIELADFEDWRIPFLSDSGFHNSFGYVVSSTPFLNEKDYLNYLKRLNALPSFYSQNVENMRAGIEAGFTQPKEILNNVLPSFEALVTARVEDHPFYAPFLSMPYSIKDDVAKSLVEEGRAILEDKVRGCPS